MSKDFGQKKFCGKFRWKKCSLKNYLFKVILIKKRRIWSRNLVKKIVVKKIGQKNVGPKEFLASNNFPRKKFVSKNNW